MSAFFIMKKRILIACGILLAIILLATSFFGGSLWGKRRALSVFSARVDTLYVEKTKSGSTALILDKKFISWDKVVVPDILPVVDTMSVPQIIRERDTTWVYVPISQTYFALNEGKVRIWASGYKVGIDRWEMDEVTKVVTRWPKQHRVYLSAEGLLLNTNPHFIMQANYGYTTKWGFEINAGLGYDFVSRGVSASVAARINLYSWD